MAATQACEFVGLPECQLTLAQAVTYLACAPKSNAATVGIGEARKDVREGRLLPVPIHLRDAHYPGAKRWAKGKTTNMPTTRKAASPRRIIWESSGNTIARSIAALSANWPSG